MASFVILLIARTARIACVRTYIHTVGSKPGDDSIQCDGVCATWLHRRCAGLSKEAFTSVSKSNDPFFCPQCRLNQQELDLKSLRDMVANLSSHITIIADELATVKIQVDELKAINQNAPSATSAVQSVSMSYASALDAAAEDGPRSKVKAKASTSAYSPTAVHNSRLPWTVLFNLFCFVLCVCFVPCIFVYFFVVGFFVVGFFVFVFVFSCIFIVFFYCIIMSLT